MKLQIDNFKVTPEMHEELKVFQGPPAEKMREIHEDIEKNVTLERGRMNLAIAFDLVFHSPLFININNEGRRRAWLQLLVVGDTGQAKTHIIEHMMEHYNAGAMVVGESAGRTGLSYALAKSHSGVGGEYFIRWGAMAMNDRHLLVVDEIQKLAQEDVQNISTARDKGEIQVDKIRKGTARSRTRMIMLANPKRKVDTYSQGIQAIMTVGMEERDIRRFDLAMVVRSGEVPVEEINQRI